MGLFDDIGKDISGVGQGIDKAFQGSSLSQVGSDIGSFVGKGVQAIGNFFGIDNNGKWTNQGGIFKWLDEGVGEITGRNQSRAALNQAGDEFNQQQAQANALVAQQQWNQQQSDILSSGAAAALRTSNSNASGANYSNSTPLAQGVGFGGTPSSPAGKDFLGL